MRSVLLYFNGKCPVTTGWHLVSAARRAGVRVRFPSDMHQAPPDTPVVRIDDSEHWAPHEEAVLAFPFRAFWAIDTHVAFDRVKQIAAHYPIVFAAQADGAEALRSQGVPAQWLPLAAAREHLVARLQSERPIDVAFIGNPNAPGRPELLRLMEAAFDAVAVDRSMDPAKIRELYGAAKVVINRSVAGDLNMRLFEAAAAGAVPVTDRLPPGQWEGVDLERVEYENPFDALERIEALLNDEAQRARIRLHNQTVVRNRHLYVHRLQTILSTLQDTRQQKGGKA